MGDRVERHLKSAILMHAFDRYSDLEELLDRFVSVKGPELVAVVGPRSDFQRASEKRLVPVR